LSRSSIQSSSSSSALTFFFFEHQGIGKSQAVTTQFQAIAHAGAEGACIQAL